MTLAPGTIVGRYRIVSLLGEGGMGSVFRAQRIDGGEDVAIKVVLEGLEDAEAIRERFGREAKALFGMEHPNVLRVFDAGDFQVDGKEGRPYLVMELLDGVPLDTMVEEGPLPPDQAFELSRQVLTGLAFAHEAGVLHRDLKTENVFVGYDAQGNPVAKILDFGLVKFVDDDRWGQSSKLTVTGAVFGTPAYMSPEQCAGAPVDARGDVYSAGVIVYELFTGAWPFMEETRLEMFKAHMTQPVPPIATHVEGAQVQPALDALIVKAMAKLPKQRFQDAREMLAALQAVPQPALVLGEAAMAPASGTPSSPLLNPFSDYPGARPAREPVAPVQVPAPEPARSPWVYVAIAIAVACVLALGLVVALVMKA